MTSFDPIPEPLIAHAAFVRRLAHVMVHDGDLADDVAQEALRAALERPPQRTGELRAWLAQVLRKLVHRSRRTEGRRRARENAVACGAHEPPAAARVAADEVLQRVVDTVRALDEPYRTVILARFYENLPPRAIAARLGVPVATVQTRYKRALQQLRARLAHLDPDWRHGLAVFAALPTSGATVTGVPLLLATAMKIQVLLGVVVGVLVFALAWAWFSADPPRVPTPVAANAAPAKVQDDPLAVAAPSREAAVAPAPPVLEGSVHDERGDPVPDVRVFVGAAVDPFPADAQAPAISWNEYRGRSFATDARGTWQATLASSARVVVTVLREESYEVVDDAALRWVEAPARGIDFVVRRWPTCTLEVRVVAGAERRQLESFTVELSSGAARSGEPGVDQRDGFRTMRAEQGVVRCVLAVRAAGGRPLRVKMSEPAMPGGRAPEAEVVLLPPRAEVTLVAPEPSIVRGQVVDDAGGPISDALVFFGRETRARGDEPFKQLRVERITDGVRSGADGWFELRGDGSVVTAVHEQWSGATVAVAQAARIQLGPRGTIVGRLLDERGSPVSGASLRLDDRRRGPLVPVDAAGRFRFEHVEAGAHALLLDGGALLTGVRVGRGETVTTDVRVEPKREIAITAQGATAEEVAKWKGVVVGLDPQFDLRGIEKGRIEGGLRRGRYWLSTDAGIAASLDVDGSETSVRIDVGAADLVVRAARKQRVQVVPADADAFTRLAAARMRVPVAPDVPAHFRLQPARYVLVGEAGAELCEIDVPMTGATVDID